MKKKITKSKSAIEINSTDSEEFEPYIYLLTAMYFIRVNLRHRTIDDTPNLIYWHRYIDDVLKYYPIALANPNKISQIRCRYAAITYQKIKRMAEAGVPDAQVAVDRLAVLFEDPLRHQIYKN